MNTNTTTTDVPAGTANVPDGSGQPTAADPVDGKAPVAQGDPGADPAAGEAGDAAGADAPAGDGKPEGEAPADPEGEGDKTGDEGAPEAYGEFTLPEGFVLEPEGLEQLTGFGKKHNLSQEAAQEALNLATAHVQRMQERGLADHQARVEQWATDARNDPVIGGKDYERNVQIALSAVGKFGDPELKEAFEQYGLGNHPAFIRAFYKVGKAAGEAPNPHGVGSEHPGAPVAFEDRFMAAAERPRAKRDA